MHPLLLQGLSCVNTIVCVQAKFRSYFEGQLYNGCIHSLSGAEPGQLSVLAAAENLEDVVGSAVIIS